MEKRRL